MLIKNSLITHFSTATKYILLLSFCADSKLDTHKFHIRVFPKMVVGIIFIGICSTAFVVWVLCCWLSHGHEDGCGGAGHDLENRNNHLDVRGGNDIEMVCNDIIRSKMQTPIILTYVCYCVLPNILIFHNHFHAGPGARSTILNFYIIRYQQCKKT